MQGKWFKTTRLSLIDEGLAAEAPQTPIPGVQSASGGPQFKWPLASRHGMPPTVEAAPTEPAQSLWPDSSPTKGKGQFKEPLASWHGMPPAEEAARTAQDPLTRREVTHEARQLKAPPHLNPRTRQQAECYANWLAKQEKHDALHDHVQQSNDYIQNATKVVKVGEKEVATFAPFRPELSALQTLTRRQAVVLCVITALWIIGMIVLRLEMLTACIAVITLIYSGNLLLNVLMAIRSLRHLPEEQIDNAVVHALKDADWPLYTILCPLYREAKVVPQFVEAIRRLDYPAEKLEVLFLTEVDDAETRSAIQALSLPSHFKIVTVPDGSPRTKPRACNYGLMQARGSYIVIYDAEDIPDPLQLKKAVLAFANQGTEVVCVQAKLNFYNIHQNLLTRWFTAEYCVWFDLILPGLQQAGFPLPLGGTSNHFRMAALRALGGWDALILFASFVVGALPYLP